MIKDEVASFTLRLPETLRQQLIVQAEGKQRSLNSHIQAILEGHIVESGFAGHHLISKSGRSFEIVFREDDIPQQRNGVMGFFFLRELKFDQERAYYMIGLDHAVVRDWKLRQRPVEAIEQIGLALLNFYNRHFEIDQLQWPHPVPNQDFDGYRVFSWKDFEPAESLNEFLDLLRKNQWKDRLLTDAGNSQDLRRGRNPSDLYK